MVRPLLVFFLLVAACHESKSVVAEPKAATRVVALLAPSESVDPLFKGCEGACGTRGEDPNAKLQPGAKIGDLAYCAVSGVVFRVTEKSPKTDVDGKPVYFCCDGCAQHFAGHRKEVLTARGL